MGKAQSKRSVDITTETKKGTEEEITEKMEKIEDLDKKEVLNGDATLAEKNDAEKKDVEEVENDKDMTTEKDVDVQASGDAAEVPNTTETSKEEGSSANAEEISPLADENIKKTKKEKVKKKWSFRSISFGKKDKQKPAKNEDAVEDGSATTEEKTTTEPEDTQKDKSANEKDEKTTENHENGNASPQELNGGEMIEEKTSEEKSNDITANTTNNTIATESCVSVQKETAAVSSELSEKTENTAVTNETKIIENATVDDASKNGNGIDEKMNTTDQEQLKTDVKNASIEVSSEKTSTVVSAVTNMSSASTNGEVVDEIHQNGDHGASEQEVIEKSKAQIEVNSNTDKVSAATLDYISTTSINPSNVQIHVQDLNASSEKPDEKVQINKDESESESESVIHKPTDIDIDTRTVSETTSVVEDFENENKVQIETTVSNIITSENLDNESSFEEKVGVDPSPPPLPISPPPSQVSVFAFTNNDESIEDNMQTEKSEPTISNPSEEEKKEVEPPPSDPPTEEMLNKQDTETIINETHGEELVEKVIILDEDDVPEIYCVDIGNTNVDIPCQENKELQDDSIYEDENKDNEELASPGISKESVIKEEEETSVDVAAAVITEITETAAEIVNQQLNCNEENITDEKFLQNNEQSIEEEVKIINENIVVESSNKTESIENTVGDLEFESETANSLRESSLVPEETNIITTECSLDITTASVPIQQEQDEVISIKKSEHLDSIKEFATAKDIKDNVTVAEITQDLSVTCE